MAFCHVHEHHPTQIARGESADGLLRAVIERIEAGKPCLEMAQQMQAVEKAVMNAKRALIRDHMDHFPDTESSETDRAEPLRIAHYL